MHKHLDNYAFGTVRDVEVGDTILITTFFDDYLIFRVMGKAYTQADLTEGQIAYCRDNGLLNHVTDVNDPIGGEGYYLFFGAGRSTYFRHGSSHSSSNTQHVFLENKRTVIVLKENS